MSEEGLQTCSGRQARKRVIRVLSRPRGRNTGRAGARTHFREIDSGVRRAAGRQPLNNALRATRPETRDGPLAFCAAFISSSDPPPEERRPSPRSSPVQILQALNLAPYVVEHAVFDNVWVIRVNQQMSAEIASAGCDLQREVVIGLARAWRPGESVSVEVESYTGRTLARRGRGWLGQPEYHCE